MIIKNNLQAKISLLLVIIILLLSSCSKEEIKDKIKLQSTEIQELKKENKELISKISLYKPFCYKNKLSDITREIIYLEKDYGTFLYSAIAYHPETRDIFNKITGEQNWQTFFPEDIGEFLSIETKNRIIISVLDIIEKKDKLNRQKLYDKLENWCVISSALHSIMYLNNIEYLFEAVYLQQETVNIFKSTKIRFSNLKKKSITAKLIINSMTSAELAKAGYETINIISNLDKKEQFDYLKKIFNYKRTAK